MRPPPRVDQQTDDEHEDDDTKTTTTKAKAASAGEKVTPADLPAAVTDAVMKAHPKGTITSATKWTKGSDVSYSVSVKDGTKTAKVMVGADGTIAPAASSTKKTTATKTTTTTTSTK